MAKKRMFSLNVLETDAFMDLPLSAQALYFHLCMRADDDGFIGNPKRITQNIGASIDDLKLLIAKRFVLVFEDGVIVIKHWRMHNAIKSDRYIKTNFIEDYSLLQIKENGAYTLQKELPGAQMERKWITNGSQMAQMRSVDKVSIDKDSLGKDKDSISDNFHNKTEPYSLLVADGNFSAEKEAMRRIVEAWNGTGLTKVKSFSLDSRRGKAMTARVNENGIEAVLEAIGKIRDCRFFHGENKRGWVATLDWLLDVDNFQKVSEGQYDAQFAAPDSSKSGGDWLLDKIARGDFDE